MVIQKLRGDLNGFDINNLITALERRCSKLMVLQIDSVLRTFENWFPREQNNTRLLECRVTFD